MRRVVGLRYSRIDPRHPTKGLLQLLLWVVDKKCTVDDVLEEQMFKDVACTFATAMCQAQYASLN